MPHVVAISVTLKNFGIVTGSVTNVVKDTAEYILQVDAQHVQNAPANDWIVI